MAATNTKKKTEHGKLKVATISFSQARRKPPRAIQNVCQWSPNLHGFFRARGTDLTFASFRRLIWVLFAFKFADIVDSTRRRLGFALTTNGFSAPECHVDHSKFPPDDVSSSKTPGRFKAMGELPRETQPMIRSAYPYAAVLGSLKKIQGLCCARLRAQSQEPRHCGLKTRR